MTEERSDEIMCKVGDVVRYGSDDGIFEGVVIKITGLILTIESDGKFLCLSLGSLIW